MVVFTGVQEYDAGLVKEHADTGGGLVQRRNDCAEVGTIRSDFVGIFDDNEETPGNALAERRVLHLLDILFLHAAAQSVFLAFVALTHNFEKRFGLGLTGENLELDFCGNRMEHTLKRLSDAVLFCMREHQEVLRGEFHDFEIPAILGDDNAMEHVPDGNRHLSGLNQLVFLSLASLFLGLPTSSLSLFGPLLFYALEFSLFFLKLVQKLLINILFLSHNYVCSLSPIGLALFFRLSLCAFPFFLGRQSSLFFCLLFLAFTLLGLAFKLLFGFKSVRRFDIAEVVRKELLVLGVVDVGRYVLAVLLGVAVDDSN